jgi:hypothetical protein
MEVPNIKKRKLQLEIDYLEKLNRKTELEF